MMTITAGNIRIDYEQPQHVLVIHAGSALWQIPEAGRIEAETNGLPVEYAFSDAREAARKTFQTGIGPGFRFVYRDLAGTGYSFETLIRIEEATGDIFFEWIPLEEEGIKIRKIYWPESVSSASSPLHILTVLPLRQGMLIPGDWEVPLPKLPFDGMFQTAGCYMPWYGQILPKKKAAFNGRGPGYMAVSLTPWDAGVLAEHPAGGMNEGEPVGTKLGQWLIPSLGCMRYRRILRYSFFDDCDFNDLCKAYRQYVNEEGKLRTLAEKAVQNPSIRDLEKCSFVHTGIKTHVQPDSDFYDAENPEKNNHLHTFIEKAEMIRDLHAAGAGRIYLHLDGWAQPGYDNDHPDYTDICSEAGGREGLKLLLDTLHENGDLFGIHDQYRDYYKKAKSFDPHYAVTNEDGSIPEHKRWAGGPQSYLCASQAPYYVKRNLKRLKENGIVPDCAYLDVFTCNDGDECFEKEHKMSRRECYEYRGRCFAYLLSLGILSSSEEAADWAAENLVFCHYAPFEFQMTAPESPAAGIPVPLYNLVYHDCILQPQPMERYSRCGRDDMLYALLCGQPPYLVRDPAYENTDGAFPSDAFSRKEMAGRCRIVSDFAVSVAEKEMVSFTFLNAEHTKAVSLFSGGKSITADFEKGTFSFC